MRREAIVSTFVALTLALGAAAVAGAGEAGPDGYVPSDAERARWTMSDMRTLGIAMEAYHIDHGAYPDGATLEDAIAKLEPMYVRKAPVCDAWGTTFKYIPAPDLTGYTIVSAGADLNFTEEGWAHAGEAEDYKQDAVLKDGKLTRSWAYR